MIWVAGVTLGAVVDADLPLSGFDVEDFPLPLPQPAMAMTQTAMRHREDFPRRTRMGGA
jgi:hypothetical protein